MLHYTSMAWWRMPSTYYLELRNAMTSYHGSMLYGHYTTLKKHSLNLLKHTFVASRNSE